MQMNKQPLVSVVIPCYNHENFVKDCIQSVIDQTYENIELIIIDDGSKDSSVEIIQKMIPACKQRFTRFEFRQRPNKGLSATLNEALEWCEGEYYSAIASDDIMLAHKTTDQVSYLEKNTHVIAVLGGVFWIDDENKIIGRPIVKEKKYSFDEIFLSKQSLNACTQMTKLEKVKEIGGYKEGCVIEDWYMWLKLSQLGGVVNLENIFVKYRLHEDNTIKKGEVIYKGMMEIANEYKFHPLYLKAIKQIMWIRVAAIILRDKSQGWVFFIELLKADKMAVFHKNFYRCLRNFYRKTMQDVRAE